MAESFPNLARDINLQVEEAEQAPNRVKPKKSLSIHNTTKLLNIKDMGKILKTTKEEFHLTYEKKHFE